MNRRQFLQSAAAETLSGMSPLKTASPQLNLLFVLMDDLGWHDLGAYGNSFIATPNTDRFARQSARFTNAYAACPVCSPTRASILTGQYPARLHLTDWIPGRKQWPTARLLTPPFNQFLPENSKTLAEVLSPAGFRTGAIGKWHLGGEGHLPTNRGFGINVGGSAAGHPPSYFGPLDLPGCKLAPGEFLTEHLTTSAANFMSEGGAGRFFLYMAQFAVHLPLEAPKDIVAKYRNLGTGDVNPVYCAMIETADNSMGRLMRTLEESRLADNTIVILFSDNGGVRFQGKSAKPVTNNTPFRAGKGHLFEGGIREPLMVRWPGVTKPGSVIEEPVSSIDFFPTLCEAANVKTGPVDGRSFFPLLQGQHLPERPLFWHYPHYSDQGGRPCGAVRLGEWKLIEFYEDGRLELYQLGDDPGERHNLISKEPERAKQLQDILVQWRLSVKAAMPTSNPDYDPVTASEGLTGFEPPTKPV